MRVRPLLTAVSTPIFVDRLLCLAEFPDQDLANYILNRFSQGFDIGFREDFVNKNTRPCNNLSAWRCSDLVRAAIERELERGDTVGRFMRPPFAETHCLPIGTVPKPDETVRLVLHLSHSRGILSKNTFRVKSLLACTLLSMMRLTSYDSCGWGHTWARSTSSTPSSCARYGLTSGPCCVSVGWVFLC